MNQQPTLGGKPGGGGANFGIAVKQVRDKSMEKQDDSFDYDESISANQIRISKFGTQEFQRMHSKDSDI